MMRAQIVMLATAALLLAETSAAHGPGVDDAEIELVVNAPVADLPVRRVVGGHHFKADLTLPYGRIVHDYLASDAGASS